MPIKLQKYIIVGVMFVFYSVGVFYAGYFKKGEVEAEKTTVAVIEKVEEVAETQTDLIDIGLEHAEVEIDIKVQNKLNEEEVKRRVKKYIAGSNKCLSPAGVRKIGQALGYTGSEDNQKPLH